VATPLLPLSSVAVNIATSPVTQGKLKMRAMTKKELLKAISDCPDDDSPVYFSINQGNIIGFISDCEIHQLSSKINTVWMFGEIQASR
jgi:hypothetical protein